MSTPRLVLLVARSALLGLELQRQGFQVETTDMESLSDAARSTRPDLILFDAPSGELLLMRPTERGLAFIGRPIDAARLRETVEEILQDDTGSSAPVAAGAQTGPDVSHSSEGKALEPEPAPPAELAPMPARAEEAIQESPAGAAEPGHLVDLMLDEIAHWTSLDEAGERLVSTVTATVGAEACAVLVQDADYWLVIAHEGLRPTEARLGLSDNAWVIENVVTAHRVLNIGDTDALRSQLAMVPLASRRCLLLAPMPGQSVLVIAARNGDAFTDGDVRSLARLCHESVPGFVQAIQLRRLARAFAPYA